MKLFMVVVISMIFSNSYSLECSNLIQERMEHNYEGCIYDAAKLGTFVEDKIGLRLTLNCLKMSGGWFSSKKQVLEPIEKSVQRISSGRGISRYDGEQDSYYTVIDVQGDIITLSTWMEGFFGRENYRISVFRCVEND